MANALVISGHLRTFKNIVDDLVNFINTNSLDVYMYIWSEKNQDEIQSVVDRLNPVKWKAEPNEIYAKGFFDAEARIER